VVLSNPAVSTTTGWPVGLWWSELSHRYFLLTERGHEMEMFSPDGGKCEADAMNDPSDYPASDRMRRVHRYAIGRCNDRENRAGVAHRTDAFDAIVVAGGQAPMFTLGHATSLNERFVAF
jgi:putative intracellular protease/amidase